MTEGIQGTGVAIVTPFKSDFSVDFDALKKLLDHLNEGGVDFLVVLGTTGESATLNREEKQNILDYVKDNNPKNLPLVAGVGGNDTLSVVQELKSYDLKGYSAILSVSPAYNKPTQDGIYQHFRHVSEASQLPIIVYNVPGRTASNITAATTLRLANDFDNIFAIKEASGDLCQVMQIIHHRPNGFKVLSGDDNLTFSMMNLGAEGAISVSANAWPKTHVQMVNHCTQNNAKSASEYHYQLFEPTNLLFKEGNPAGVKSALKSKEIMTDVVRLPLVSVSNQLANQLNDVQLS